MQANGPGIVIKQKQNRTCQLIDMSVSSDSNISAKELANIIILKLKLLRYGK